MAEPLIYLAGPLNHGGLGDYEQNLAAAIHLAEWLEGCGCHVFCPHRAFRTLRWYAPEPMVLDLCCAVLSVLDPRSTILYLAPGWHGSDGSHAEAAVAAQRGIRVVAADEDATDYEGQTATLRRLVERYHAD